MTRSDARLRLVVSGVVASVVIHALLLAGLGLIPEPEKKPDCPTQEEVCRAVCLDRPAPAIPEACPEPQPCECELVEIVAMPTPPVVPEVVPPMVAPESVPPPPQPPPPAPEPVPSEATEKVTEKVTEKASVEKKKKKNKAALRRAEAAARSVAIVKVLGTQGGAGAGMVYDIVESSDNNLADLFAQGMTTSVATESRGVSALVDAGGGGSADVVEQSLADAVRRKLRELQKCHTKSTIEAGVEGKLGIALTIDDAGRPTKVAIESDTTESDEIRACVVRIVEGWRLPAGNAGETRFSAAFVLD